MVARTVRDPIDLVVAEYLEMPGLALTKRQACRLWGLDEATCGRLLDQLVGAKFLKRAGPAVYVRADVSH